MILIYGLVEYNGYNIVLLAVLYKIRLDYRNDQNGIGMFLSDGLYKCTNAELG